MLRHIHKSHGLTEASYVDIAPPEHSATKGIGTSQHLTKKSKIKPGAKKFKKRMKGKLGIGKSSKLMVKFNVKHQSSATSEKNSSVAEKASTSAAESVSMKTTPVATGAPAPQKTDRLSRVVDEIMGDNGQVVFKCKECQFTSDDKQSVAKHAVSWHVDTRAFSCSNCDYITFERNDLIAHNITHRNEHQFRCEECTYSTDLRVTFDRHLQNHKGNYPFKCTKCTYSCGSDAALRRHFSSNHDPIPTPERKTRLQAPKQITASTDLTPMEESSNSFVEDNFSDSQSTSDTNSVSMNVCFDPCSASMVPRPSLPPLEGESAKLFQQEIMSTAAKHSVMQMYVAQRGGQIVCPICNHHYKRTPDLNRHMKRKHGCSLQQHLKSKGKGFRWTDFSGNFSGEDDLQDGEKSEKFEDVEVDDDDDDDEDDDDDDEILPSKDKGSKSMEDEEQLTPEQLKCRYCNYQAKFSSDLKRHLTAHSIEKRFKCNFCSKKYKYRCDLNMHVRKEHKREPSGEVKVVKVATQPRRKSGPAIFKCPCCNYSSPWKSEIDRHSKLHNAEKTFQCNNCPYQTYWRSDIRRHVYRKHPEIMVEGLALNDVILIRKVPPPSMVNASENKSLVKAEAAERQSLKTTFVKTDSREQTPEINMSEFVVSTPSGKSPSPSPIKEIGNGIFKCQYCGFEANAPSKMNAHIATHTNLKRYMCPHCGRRANWKWDIAKHIKVTHGDNLTQVIKMSKKAAEESIQAYMEANAVVRRDHHLNATPERELEDEKKSQKYVFKCSSCAYTEDKRISVARHIKLAHSGEDVMILTLLKKEKPFTETSTSTKSSSSNKEVHMHTPSKFSHLIENTNVKDDMKPFMCSECGKRGNTKGDIKKHYHYVHSDKEIRIVYLGDNSQIVEPQIRHEIKESSPSPERPLSFNQPPSKDPKKIGYIRPFQCGMCGRRSNWRWDVTRHIRERHPDMIGKIEIIEIPEDIARATIEQYAKEQLPSLNKLSLVGPKKKRRKSMALDSSLSDKDNSFSGTSDMESSSIDAGSPMKDGNTQSPPVKVQIFSSFSSSHAGRTVHDSQSLSPGKIMGRKHGIKQFKCSVCSYRADKRGDVNRHMRRRHGPNRRIVVLEKDLARATVGTYKYDRYSGDGQPQVVNTDLFPTLEMKKPKRPTHVAVVERKVWKCGMCAHTNPDKVEMLKHLSKHNMKAFKCSVCDWTSNFRSAVLRHIQSKHQDQPDAQSRLNIKLISVKEEVTAQESGQFGESSLSAQPSESSEAPVPVTGQESLSNPNAMTSTAIYYCKICNHSSTWRSCVCRHLKSVHKTRDYIGNIVKKIVKVNVSSKVSDAGSGGSSTKEDQTWVAPKNFSCEICPYRAYKSKMLRFHMTCHKPQAGVKQVKCKYCPYYVSSNRLLTQHVFLHLNDMRNSQETEYPRTPVKSSKSKSSAVHIAKSPQVAKRHRCEKCPYTTNSKNDFLYHKQFHRPKPTADFKCDYCDYWVSHRRLIKQHMKVHDENYVMDTGHSPEVTPSKSDYSENSLIYDTVEIAAIKQRIIASKITPNLSSSPLVSPMKIAATCTMGGKRGFLRKDGSYRKIHQCQHCPYMNLKLRNMKLHELMHGKRSSTNTLLKCPMCDYYVASRGLLGQHMRVHKPNYANEFLHHGNMRALGPNGAGASKSNGEDADIETSVSLEKKVETLLQITRFKKFGCEKCPYASAKRSRFQRHVELHGSKQKFKCDFCDYSVPTQNLLNQHTRLHFEPNQNLLAAQSILNLQNLPEMPADVALASMMANKDAQNPVSITHDHIELYENQPEDLEPKRLYRCDRCPYANVRRDHLLAHLRCHMTKNEYACPYCDYSIGKTSVLVQHVKVHFSPLPELYDWLAENGDTERLRELRGRKLIEGVEVVKMLQDGQKMEISLKGLYVCLFVCLTHIEGLVQKYCNDLILYNKLQ